MDSSDFNITLDIHDMSSPVSLNVKQGDSSRRICVNLMENGVPYKIDPDCSAVFSGRKPDGNVVWNSCSIEGNRIIYEITPQTTVVAGIMPCQIRLYGAGNNLISSPDFTLIVDSTVVNNDEIVSTNEITALTELVCEATALIKKLELNASMKVVEISLSADNWIGESAPYAQVVAIDGVTERSAVDLRPSVEQLSIFYEKDLTFVTENEDGVVTVYAIGDKPLNDYVIQATVTETEEIT